ncbi:MAG: polymer-forming cytoskeletal protein [Candidatus Omnitrophica bacterium]|nr:polymer-forming cytoskeletal protein [Candidatus Omnitrophota bacterium]
MAIMGKGKGKPAPESGDRVLDVTASMQGSLVFQEPVSLRISGRFQGTLQTRGSLTIGDEAVVQADITGEEVIVAGRVNGKLIAKNSLRLVPPALVTGEVWTPVLEVEQGARLDGEIHMAETQQNMSLDEVAEYLEVESRLLEQWAREGKIPGSQEQGRWWFDRTKIDQWVASQKSS